MQGVDRAGEVARHATIRWYAACGDAETQRGSNRIARAALRTYRSSQRHVQTPPMLHHAPPTSPQGMRRVRRTQGRRGGAFGGATEVLVCGVLDRFIGGRFALPPMAPPSGGERCVRGGRHNTASMQVSSGHRQRPARAPITQPQGVGSSNAKNPESLPPGATAQPFNFRMTFPRGKSLPADGRLAVGCRRDVDKGSMAKNFVQCYFGGRSEGRGCWRGGEGWGLPRTGPSAAVGAPPSPKEPATPAPVQPGSRAPP